MQDLFELGSLEYMQRQECPNCGSIDFASNLVYYERVEWNPNRQMWDINDVEMDQFINVSYYCENCGKEVDIDKTRESNKIILKGE